MNIAKRRKSLLYREGRIVDRIGDEEEYENDIRFVYRYISYLYNTSSHKFEPILYKFNDTYDRVHERKTGLNEEDIDSYRHKFGTCTMKIIIKPWYDLIIEEILNFYYAIQAFSIIIWFMNEYYRSGAIVRKFNHLLFVLVIMTTAAMLSELYDQLQSLQRLKEMAHHETEIFVKRTDQNGASIRTPINSDDIVPGDIIIVPDGQVMP